MGIAPAIVKSNELFGGIAPLMYHSVSPDPDDPYQITVRPERLQRQLGWLRRLGRRGVSVAELIQARRDGGGQRLVGLTFDDGYADFVDYALAALQRYQFTATVFVLGGRLGGDNAWNAQGPRKPLMTPDQVRQVAAAGMEIGSHGLRHISLPAVSDDELAAELWQSRRILQDISGQSVGGFCYPYGHLDARAVSGVQAAQYDYACAIWPSKFTGQYAIRRTYIRDGDSPPRLWADGMWSSVKGRIGARQPAAGAGL
jgi:peptidoglycan/xylan/chitin deacetylase (PgdA/CDA1 family)